MKVLAIYGCGGAGRESKEIAELQGNWKEIVFVDDAYSNDLFKGIHRYNYSEFRERFQPDEAEFTISLGEPELKVRLYNKLSEEGFSFANIVHPTAIISPSATIGNGLILKAHSIISADAVVGNNVSIEENGIIGHDSVIGDHCQISANVVVAGNCHIGEATYIGLGVPIKQGSAIGANCVIGMGSVVVRDIPDNVIAVGNPCRVLREITEEDRDYYFRDRKFDVDDYK